MSLTLTVDGERWRTHLRAFADRHPGLVPVAKGNGYGFTLGRLARKAEWLGADTLAVGTYEELPEVASRFDGDLLVLTPWRPFVDDLDPALADRVIHTVGRSDDLDALLTRQPNARVVLERMTSMLRHGFAARELWGDELRRQLDKARLEGIALHLPLAQGAHIAEVSRLLNDVVGMDLDAELDQGARPSGSATSPTASSTGCRRRTPTSRSGPASAPACGWATGRR